MKLIYCILYIQLRLRKESLGLTGYIMALILGIGLVGLVIGMSSLHKISLISSATVAFCHVLGASSLIYDTLKEKFYEGGDDFINFKRQYFLNNHFAKAIIFYIMSILVDTIYSLFLFFIFGYIPVLLGFITYKADVSIIYSIILILWSLLVAASLFRSSIWLKLGSGSIKSV